ncbi:hypothetical protein [Flavobacterium piscisymbiosum]|uniref:Lipoprotein n=1 Tax=Flavobacterium piscisymbiosum TaxID=2893753 RepID=A0ABS8MA04_9FLAO|nr:hypothetical protein [Flavobacterium sp. F-30]MCC9062340.1 hypothetical protein [Flavobacterium sp. F-30]
MKKLKLSSFFFTPIIVMTLMITSCKDSEKKTITTQSNAFAGTWVAKDFSDNMIVNKGIETVKNGVTEITIPKKITDSISFLNEDLESAKYSATIKNDTLINHLDETNIQKAIIKNGNLILLPLDDRYHSQEYTKADASLVKKAKDANVSVFRILINKTLSDNTYTNGSSKNKIKFSEDGNVAGLANFKNYYISVNGDAANIENMTAINFTTVDRSSKNLGIEFKKDIVNLYDLILLTKSGEKPYYKKGKLLYSLMAI